jgi:DNA topoisomerase I
VTVVRGAVRFRYPAKGGIERTLDVTDEPVRKVVKGLLERATDQPELLAYRAGGGWCDVKSADINAYLRDVGGMDISAKDFRTWNGTVLAAVTLARDELEYTDRRRSAAARNRAVSHAMKEVADYLGNTPTVARKSYVDPRVVDLFTDGTTIAAAITDLRDDRPSRDPAIQETLERAVLDLLATR